MKALVKTASGPGNLEIWDRSYPRLINEQSVIIRVRACGICGTDVHIWQDKFRSWPPVTIGHEFSGEIVETGSACTKFTVGDRVVSEPQVNHCDGCEYCRAGKGHLCPQKLTMGWRTDGAMQEYVSVQERYVHRMPEGLDFELASLCEPVAITVYDVVESDSIHYNDFVVVQGSGPIGILSAYHARKLGAHKVLLTGIDQSEICRFGVARVVGTDILLNVQKQNLREAVMDLTGGRGADCVVETSGAPSAIAESVALLKKNGVLIGTGIPSSDQLPFPWKDAVLKALQVRLFMSSSYTSWDKALNCLQQDADILRHLITWTGPIEDWEKVFNELVEEKHVKGVFTF